MIIDYEYSNRNLIVSYFNKKGNIKLKYFPWTPTKFIATSLDDPERHEKYVTWDGKPTKEIYTKYPNKYSIYDFLESLPEEETEEIYGYYEPNIYFIDIETEITTKKLRPELAESRVISLSIVVKDKILVLGTDPLDKKQTRSITNDINNDYGVKFDRKWEFKYIQYKSEYEMLYNFFNVMVPKMSVMTGWNFIHFDWVFLVARARKLGINPDVSSFTGRLEPLNERDPRNFAELPKHRLIIDYMEIFQKWDQSIKIKESNALNFVAENVLKLKKVDYEGDLKVLYETDKKKFIYYNAIDSILVQLIHEKTKLADIMYGIATLSRTTVSKALSTLNITEGIMRKPLIEVKNIKLVKNEDVSGGGGVKGGWVKEPIRGMATWTCCYDFASLYPTTMRQFNISADSYKGQKIVDSNYSLFNGQKILIEDTDIVTISGAVFKNEIGVVNQVLTDIYAERKSYKKTMMAKNIEIGHIQKEIEELENSIVNY